eukprot:8849855-Alexandrium_andersonii.AAC.1
MPLPRPLLKSASRCGRRASSRTGVPPGMPSTLLRAGVGTVEVARSCRKMAKPLLARTRCSPLL